MELSGVNEQLHDAAIHHAVDFQQYSNGVVRRIIGLLNRVDPDLMAQLNAVLESLSPSTFNTERLEQLLHGVRALNREAYQAIERELSDELASLTAYEVGYQAELFQVTIPPQVVAQVGLGTVDAGQVHAAAMARPFQGVLLKEALAGLEESRARLIRDAVRIGFVENQTIGDIVRRVRGTRAKGYADGLLEAPRRHVESIVRTAVSHTAGFARDRFNEANGSLIKAVVWTATLDTRTSETCRLRDGKKYTNEDHKPIGHKLPWLAGPGRAHWCCRSVSVPVTKSWRELGLDIDEMSQGTRASMDGQVPAGTTYGDWIKKQGQKRQDEVLGPNRGALLRQGKLPIDKFANNKGQWLTLAQLKEREAKAFDRSGLNNPMRPPRGVPQDEIAKFLASPADQQVLLQAMYKQNGYSYDKEATTLVGIKKAEGYKASVESLAGVRFYTGSGYAEVNQRMREGGGTLADRQFTALTATALPGMKPYEKEVWRAPTRKAGNAQKWWDKAEVGQPMDLGNQLQSFSASSGMAVNWAGKSDVVLRIADPTGGAYISPVSLHPGESEVLLPPGQVYRVVAKTSAKLHGRDMRVIDLEIVRD